MANKKYLDEVGLAYVLGKLEDYPNNEILATLIDAMQDALDEKASTDLATTSSAGLMSALDKQTLDNLNPNIAITMDNMAVEQVNIINAKQEDLLNFEGIIEPQISSQIRTTNLLDVNGDVTPGYYLGSNGAASANTNDILGDFIPVTPGQVIYYTGHIGPTSSGSINRRLHVFNANKTWIKQMSYASNLHVGDDWSTHATVPSNGAYVRVSWGSADTHVMISVGAPDGYKPYYITPYLPLSDITFYNSPDTTIANGHTYTESLPIAAGNVYSLKFNPIQGKIWVTSNHIASYNGETLPGIWWSDRDTYAENTSPSIGAEVVYALDEEDYIEYDATTVVVPLYYHTNYFWIENGLITLLSYYAETFAANHITVYDGVTFGNTHIVESDITAWNDTVTALNTKADLNSPTFTGNPTVDHAPGRADSSLRIATAGFVQNLGNNIAPVEVTNKASQNYNAGDYIIMQGVFYKVITTIAKGTTFVSGTNITPTTVADELKALINS